MTHVHTGHGPDKTGDCRGCEKEYQERKRLLSEEQDQNFLKAKKKTEEIIREKTQQDILSEISEEWLAHQLIGHLNHDETETYRAGLIARTIITKIKQAAKELKKDNDG
jgi:hypothetical protein